MRVARLTLATRIDNSATETGSALATLVKQLEVTAAAALADAAARATPWTSCAASGRRSAVLLPGDVERRVTTQLVVMGRADSAVAVAARRLARMIDGAAARADDDVAVAHEALDGLRPPR